MKQYSKETLRQLEWSTLNRLQDKIGDRLRPVSIVNIVLSVTSLILEDGWIKIAILACVTILMAWTVVNMVRYKRIEKIMDEK